MTPHFSVKASLIIHSLCLCRSGIIGSRRETPSFLARCDQGETRYACTAALGQSACRLILYLAVTSATLKDMKGAKMLGLSHRLHGIIEKLRNTEISAAFQFRVLMSAVITIGTSPAIAFRGHALIASAFMPQTLAPVVAFGASLAGMTGQTSLAGGRLFTSLLLLRLLTQPLTQLFQAVPILASSLACMNRIQKYACSEERTDKRLHDDGGRERIAEAEESRVNGLPAVRDGMDANTRISDTEPIRRPAIHIVGGNFGWSNAEDPSLVRNIVLDLQRQHLLMLVGPAGAGKSTLIKGLLGETPHFEGHVEVSDEVTGFCDQTPWLTNGTVQDNILGGSSWDAPWYRTVVHACVLDEDFASMGDGDQSVLGSHGINLSGGQKQRVVIRSKVSY